MTVSVRGTPHDSFVHLLICWVRGLRHYPFGNLRLAFEHVGQPRKRKGWMGGKTCVDPVPDDSAEPAFPQVIRGHYYRYRAHQPHPDEPANDGFATQSSQQAAVAAMPPGKYRDNESEKTDNHDCIPAHQTSQHQNR